jgi:hypothetical protein
LEKSVWLSVFFLVWATLAHAEPRHVRIAWNVQTGVACGHVNSVSQVTFVLPLDLPCDAAKRLTPNDSTCNSIWCEPVRDLVKKGDYVTVYAYNYNPVSYKPLAPVVTVVKPEEPVPVTLLTAILQATGFRISVYGRVDTPDIRPTGSRCVEQFDAGRCLSEVRTAVAAIKATVDRWESQIRVSARALAEARGQIPRRLRDQEVAYPDFGLTGLTDLGCRFSIVDGRNPLGETCQAASGWIQDVGAAFGKASALIRAFDAAYDPTRVTADQIVQRDQYQQAVDNYLDYVSSSERGARSELSAGVTQLAEDLAAIKSYRSALNPANAGSYAVELPRQGPVGSLNRLIFALPLRFVGAPDGAPAQLTSTFSIEVVADRPVVLPAAGIVWLPWNFDFKNLAIEQVPNVPPLLARRLITVDSDQFSTVTAILTTNFRLSTNPSIPYFAFGTTGDKNIFKSALLGGAWFVPRWRSLITGGILLGKGTTEDELQSVIAGYSFNGFVSDSINLGQIPLKKSWHATLVVGWTFTPF